MLKKLIKWTGYGPFSALYHFFLIKEVRGNENLPKRGGFIIAANHMSYLDIPSLSFIIHKSIKKEARYIAKKELFYNPIMRYLLETAETIPVDRGKKDGNVFKEAITYLKKGGVIAIYPEGTRTLTGKIQKGKTGVARLALWAKVPVVPVGIKGTFELMPSGRILPKLKKSIIVNIGKPLYFNKYYGKKITKRLIRGITDAIMKNILNLAGQEYAG